MTLNYMRIDGEWVSADDPLAALFMAAEARRAWEAKELAEASGFEVLTPAAAVELFEVTPGDVRTARIRGNVAVSFTLELTGKPLHLVNLQSAVEYWGQKKRPTFDTALATMRRAGTLVGVNWIAYDLLHDRPLVRLEDVVAEDR